MFVVVGFVCVCVQELNLMASASEASALPSTSEIHPQHLPSPYDSALVHFFPLRHLLSPLYTQKHQALTP